MEGITTLGLPEAKTKADGVENAVAKDANWGRKDEVTQFGNESEIDEGAVEGTDSRLNEAYGGEVKSSEVAEAVEQQGAMAEVLNDSLVRFLKQNVTGGAKDGISSMLMTMEGLSEGIGMKCDCSEAGGATEGEGDLSESYGAAGSDIEASGICGAMESEGKVSGVMLG